MEKYFSYIFRVLRPDQTENALMPSEVGRCFVQKVGHTQIFQVENLPKAFRSLLRKTFLRNVLQKGLRTDSTGKVEVVPKARDKWLLRRLLCKTERMKSVLTI
ncbi:hypothetical protein [Desulfonema ishimotonii]|uniref:hypothetical protein n=1 Tax=Desulfonema ishimotonii TaxID=45657 RepID=UPI000F588759|nr:hypothetical protein [Desulfonema ishimotonii]